MTAADPPPPGRDRLRELLDAVLDDDHRTLGDMARGANASPFHFARQVRRDAGEPPAALRRRVVLERAAWQLARGAAVHDAAEAAGYDSVDGFSRAFATAFGHPPSATPSAGGPTDHWLPAPNGIHFHPPTSLWVEDDPAPGGGEVTALMVAHDLADTRGLLDAAAALPPEDLVRPVLTDHQVLPWNGPEQSLGDVLGNLISSKEVWLAAIEGADLPDRAPADVAGLVDRHQALVPRWLAAIRDIDRRAAWGDRLVDALCDPPETFVLAGVLAHVLTFAAVRRGLARQLLARLGHPIADHGDPLLWMTRPRGGP